MNVSYILIASGSIILPEINHALLNAHDPNTAEKEIEQIIAVLAKAGYTRFTMYDVYRDHKVYATYNVETPKPIVYRKTLAD